MIIGDLLLPLLIDSTAGAIQRGLKAHDLHAELVSKLPMQIIAIDKLLRSDALDRVRDRRARL